MSERDTMFNERDRRCTVIQHMLSTDPSYDKRTIASILKMQIRTVQRLRAQLNASDDPLEVVERKDIARKTRTKESIEKVQAIIDETPQRPILQMARDLGVSHTTVNACEKEDMKCRSYRRHTSWIVTGKTKNFRLIKSVRPPSSPRPETAGLLRLIIRREHHQHDLLQHKSQPDRRHPPSSRWSLWKRHAPSSRSVSRRELRLKAAILNRCRLYYYMIKLPELIFSLKVLK